MLADLPAWASRGRGEWGVRRFANLKALGLGAVALVLMAVMAWLGMWQLGVYDSHQHSAAEAALKRAPVPLSSIFGPDEAFPGDAVSRPVVVTGRFLTAQQVYVRKLAGSPGPYAVATPLVTSNGSAILVVRGATSRLGVGAPSGQVTVHGVLEPSGSASAPPDKRRVVSRLSVASLVGSINPDLYTGYVVQRSSSPPATEHLAAVTVPLPHPSRWSGVRNLLYACQWWIFAAFVAFMWWRVAGDFIAEGEDDDELAEGRAEPLRNLR